ncbi:MAG: hypothetical protein J6Z11_12475 [Candidatus Riflebacteria bacterium]|nr:hypothetical protein [Candidatus Riflebacteria bacterium]
MKLSNLTEVQRDKICDFIIAKYCPIAEDGFRHKIWKACAHCPFSVSDEAGGDVCAEYLLDRDLPEEFEEVIKND